MPCIARLRLFASHIEVTGRNGHVQRFRIEWIPPILAGNVLYLSVVAAVEELSDYSVTTVITLAAFATERGTCRKSKIPPPANASPPANSASNSAAGQTFVNHCQQKPNGSTANAINALLIKSKRSKHKPTRHASANRSTFAPSLITPPRSAVSALSAMPPNSELPCEK